MAEKLRNEMGPDVVSERDDFLATVDKDVNFTPFGELIHQYKVTVGTCFKNGIVKMTTFLLFGNVVLQSSRSQLVHS